ncbi:MAG TPA: hypothetical protein O0Y01_04060 [Methanocorpusculum sp.]|nr:hypothetical protein [Methanocorpusculum sp.]
MNKKKIISLIVVLLAIILILLAVCTLSSPHEGGINLLPLNSPPGENTVIVPVTEEDLDRHPALRIALETSEPIVISKNPIHILQFGERCITIAEAREIENKFSFMYMDNDTSSLKYRYILWNNTYYQVESYRV